MTELVSARPLYLDTDWGPVFGLLHAPPAASSGTSVLLVGPWGWDEVVTYRSRRDWAEDLAASGHAALRIDLPGSGDSAGSHADDHRVQAWVAAVVAAVSYLRLVLGSRRVAVIGMGLGGLIVGRALDEGAVIDDLVLWAAPMTGRTFLREMRAFASLQSTRFSLTGEPEPRRLPDGWMEVGGFVLSAETIAALESLDLTTGTLNGLQRALLLDRDGLPIDEGLRTHLASSGAEVAVGAGRGWAAMSADIEQHRPPLDVFTTVAAFLAAPTDGSRVVPAGQTAAVASARMRVGRASIRESTVASDQPSGQTFGVISEPDWAAQSDLGAVFLNAGAVRRIGPNRMWVDAARRWAARGIPSLRLDIEAIGDADGDATVFADVNAFYRAGLEAQIVAAMDLLEARGLGRRFVLVGLCSGAYWAFRVALEDDRVAAVVMLNPRALIWDPHLFTRLASRDARKVLRRGSWGRFVRGQISAARLGSVARAVGRSLTDALLSGTAGRLRRRGRGRSETVEGSLADLDGRGTRVVLAFSDDEPLGAYLADRGLPARFRRWPNAAFVRLPGRDHTVRPIVAQMAVQALLNEVLDQVTVAEVHPERGSERVAQPSSPTP